jgi:hypothetical protein
MMENMRSVSRDCGGAFRATCRFLDGEVGRRRLVQLHLLAREEIRVDRLVGDATERGRIASTQGRQDGDLRQEIGDGPAQESERRAAADDFE